jgi:acetylornithine/succinyldiaminopimelate/putrescine aminotransferase
MFCDSNVNLEDYQLADNIFLMRQLFGYDKFVAMTSGAEAASAAVKIVRKWGYKVKGIADGQGHVLTATACYHGSSLTTVSLASKKSHREPPSSFSIQLETH